MSEQIQEVQPGQFVDQVESLARAIHDTSLLAAQMTWPNQQLYCGSWEREAVPFDECGEDIKTCARHQARLLLQRMSR